MMNLVSTMIRTLPGLRQLITLCLPVILSCTFISISAMAQDQDDSAQQEAAAADTDEQDDEQEESNTDEEESSSSVGRNSPNTFVPSEGISEDLSVSFPVDI